MDEQNKIQIYQSQDGKVQLDVLVDLESVWLTLNQISSLLGRNKSVISRHIKNVFEENELDINSTVAKFATVQSEGGRLIERQIEFYNLDVIISVGYRVKSKQGTQFRIWANSILKDYLIKGYSINEKRIKDNIENFKSLKYSIELLEKISTNQLLAENEIKSLVYVIAKFSKALNILDSYDHQTINVKSSNKEEKYHLNYHDAINIISELKEKFGGSELFGKEKDNSFESSISTIYQTFDGLELYPSLELKAINLLYFIVKNHSFVDGNKRIAAAIFIWYLYKNELLFDLNENKLIDDNTIIGMTLMIAESDPKEKEMIVKVLTNLF